MVRHQTQIPPNNTFCPLMTWVKNLQLPQRQSLLSLHIASGQAPKNPPEISLCSFLLNELAPLIFLMVLSISIQFLIYNALKLSIYSYTNTNKNVV